jgi:hypothetical protein
MSSSIHHVQMAHVSEDPTPAAHFKCTYKSDDVESWADLSSVNQYFCYQVTSQVQDGVLKDISCCTITEDIRSLTSMLHHSNHHLVKGLG